MSIRGTKEKLEKKLQEGGHREVQETSVYRQREQCKLLSKNKSVPLFNLKLTGHWWLSVFSRRWVKNGSGSESGTAQSNLLVNSVIKTGTQSLRLQVLLESISLPNHTFCSAHNFLTISWCPVKSWLMMSSLPAPRLLHLLWRCPWYIEYWEFLSQSLHLPDATFSAVFSAQRSWAWPSHDSDSLSCAPLSCFSNSFSKYFEHLSCVLNARW